MEPVESTAVFEPSELPSLLHEVLGMSETDLAVCHALHGTEEATVKELTSKLDRDRSTVSRSVSRLAERDLVEERSRIPESGGRVNVYSALPMEEVQRRLKRNLYGWVDAGAEQVDDLDQTKMEVMAERASEPVPEADAADDAGELGGAAEAEQASPADDGVDRPFLDRILPRKRS